MKRFIPLFSFLLLSALAFSQTTEEQRRVDSAENSFKYQHGTITLRNGIGTITVPRGFKYLEPVQAERVLTQLWGNPKGDNMTLGFLMPENAKVLSPGSYVFNIQYDEMGYVKDDDADEIDYDDLLKDIQKETEEANKERIKAGYDAVSIVGWAAKPYYDEDRKILHWAKEVKFGNESENTLNYNVRVLGRKGVLVLNAISGMKSLKLVQRDIPEVLDVVNFADGYKYSDFNPSMDKVAAWTLGGLVAGKILAKVGLLAMLLKFWKLIVIAVAGAFTSIRKWFSRKEEKPALIEAPAEPGSDID